MKKLVFACLTLTALGALSLPAHAQSADSTGDTPPATTTVTGDHVNIQEVNMTVDQMGKKNKATMSGTVRNRTSIQGQPAGSVGSVQRGNATTYQTGEGNEGSIDFTIENRTRQRQ